MSDDAPTQKLTPSSNEPQDDARTIEERVQILEEKFDKRGYDTRPLWEALEKRVNELQDTIGELQGQIKKIEIENATLHTKYRTKIDL